MKVQKSVLNMLKSLFGTGILALHLGCAKTSSTPSDIGSSLGFGIGFKAFCNTEKAFDPTTTTIPIVGTALYTPLLASKSGLSEIGSPQPIRFAEVLILNSDGEVIQCGETDNTGAFALNLAGTAGSYTLAVNSRANNSHLKLQVLADPTTKQFYSVVALFSIAGGEPQIDLGQINASYTGNIEAGAFNIYDQILKTNDYLRLHSGQCSGCLAFDVAPLLYVYWKKGFNPGSYYGYGPLSFYDSESKGMFILGGSNNDVDRSDTDHFDNSVIIHEYGHFLEDTYAVPDSPGGSHNGNAIIDPRLAWGEGFADFFQAAIRNEPDYIDTYGNINGSTGLNIYVKINSTPATADMDVPSALGEGNFREFSITRALWAIIQPNGLDFSFLWHALADPTLGMKNSNYSFRNVGLYYEILTSLVTTKDNSKTSFLAAAIGTELQRPNRLDYGLPLSTSGNCSSSKPFSIQGADEHRSYAGQSEYAFSNLFESNDFFQITHEGGAFDLQLFYDTGSPATDLDLFIYKEDYVYGESATMAGAARTRHDTGSERVASPNLAAGNYLINVKVYTLNGLGSSVQYGLTYNGGSLCPQ